MIYRDADGNALFEYSDETRTYFDHVTGESRPYTAEENAALDARLAQEAQKANKETLLNGLANVLDRAAAYQAEARAILDETNANINSNPAQRIKTLARGQKRVAGDIMRIARLVGNYTDSADVGDQS